MQQIIFNFVLFEAIDFIQYKFDPIKHSKDALNHPELCEIAIQR